MTKFIPDETLTPATGNSLPRTQPHSREQQQQWLLTLEKAHLSLRAAGAEADSGDATAIRTAPSRAAVDTKPAAAPAPVVSTPDENDVEPLLPRERALGSMPDWPNAGATPPLGGGQMLPSVALTRAAGFKPALVPRQLPPTVPLPQRVVGEIPELKSASLLKTEQGLHLVVRDFHSGELRPLITRLRRTFADLQLPLVRITLNGVQAWSQAGVQENPRAEAAAVNKIY